MCWQISQFFSRLCCSLSPSSCQCLGCSMSLCVCPRLLVREHVPAVLAMAWPFPAAVAWDVIPVPQGCPALGCSNTSRSNMLTYQGAWFIRSCPFPGSVYHSQGSAGADRCHPECPVSAEWHIRFEQSLGASSARRAPGTPCQHCSPPSAQLSPSGRRSPCARRSWGSGVMVGTAPGLEGCRPCQGGSVLGGAQEPPLSAGTGRASGTGVRAGRAVLWLLLAVQGCPLH